MNSINQDLIKLKISPGFSRGNLLSGETGKQIPIPIKRFYFINNLRYPKKIRGMHAHKNLEQIIFCVNGSFELYLDDGKKKQKIVMDRPFLGVRIRKMVWHHMTNFSPACIIFVMASDHYKESDYIRDYDKFQQYFKSNNHG